MIVGYKVDHNELVPREHKCLFLQYTTNPHRIHSNIVIDGIHLMSSPTKTIKMEEDRNTPEMLIDSLVLLEKQTKWVRGNNQFPAEDLII